MTSKKKWSKVSCSLCKKEKVVNPKALEARIIKYGSLQAINEKWVCRDCFNKEKGTSKKEEESKIEPFTKEKQLGHKIKKTSEEFFSKQ